MIKKKICVIGLGYVGLPTACVFARAGHSVLGVDLRKDVVDLVNRGECHVEEPGLAELVRDVVEQRKLRASTAPEESDVFIIAVPSPIIHDTKKADLSFVENASKSIARLVRPKNLVILESTVPPGTVEEVMVPAIEANGGPKRTEFFAAHAPERLLPGQILKEIIENNRIIGGTDKESTKRCAELYATMSKGEILTTDARTAEMAKLMENAFRDVNIAFANEMALVCEELGINVWDVIALANKHPRVHIHSPGPGVGGHCIAVDPWFIFEKSGKARMIKLARETNDGMPSHVVELVKSNAAKGSKIAVLGVAYKADVDDSRESPSTEIIHLLKEAGYEVAATDPFVKDYKPCPLMKLSEALSGASAAVLATNHKPYLSLSPGQASQMKEKVLIDTRNFMDKSMWEKSGFRVIVLGNGKARKA